MVEGSRADRRNEILRLFALFFTLFIVSTWFVIVCFLFMSQRGVIESMDSTPAPGVFLFEGDNVALHPAHFTDIERAECQLLPDGSYDCKFDNGEFHGNVPVYYTYWPQLPPRPAIAIVCPRLEGITSSVVLWDKCRIDIKSEQNYAYEALAAPIIFISAAGLVAFLAGVLTFGPYWFSFFALRVCFGVRIVH
jgi:hypothetical protein